MNCIDLVYTYNYKFSLRLLHDSRDQTRSVSFAICFFLWDKLNIFCHHFMDCHRLYRIILVLFSAIIVIIYLHLISRSRYYTICNSSAANANYFSDTFMVSCVDASIFDIVNQLLTDKHRTPRLYKMYPM